MSAPPAETPTPSTLGAIDLDPWIPKPSTRDIVDHLVQEINAAKQIAEEITSVQNVLDGHLEGDTGSSVVERVQKELEEKTRRVEELENLLGAEREEKRALEESIRNLEDERAINLSGSDGPATPDIQVERDVEEKTEEEGKPEVKSDSPMTSLSIPEGQVSESATETMDIEVKIDPASPPHPPSTAPSSPLPERSISPISLPSTESSQHDPHNAALLDKIAALETLLASAQKEIEEYKTKLETVSPVIAAVTANSKDFPFTFSAPTNGSIRTSSLRRRIPSSPRRRVKTEEVFDEGAAIITRKDGDGNINHRGRDFIEGLVAAMGVVVLGWMGMWMINSLVERGEKAAR